MLRRKQRSSFDQISEFDRGRIVAYRDCGLYFREIGSRVGRSQTTIMRICDRYMQEGTTDRRVRSHPPQCTTSRADRQILRMTVTDRSVISRIVAQHIPSVTHHPVSSRTIRRRLQQSSLFARRPLLRLPLTQYHSCLCRQWCDERSMWTAECNEIVFTDESRFCLQHHGGRILVWRHRGERILNSCVMHRHTGSAQGIMVFSGIGYHSPTTLVRIAGTLNSQHYISEELTFLTFRACPQAYFNRITSSAATPDQLWQRVEAACSAVPQEYIQSLFESMPRRVAAGLEKINQRLQQLETSLETTSKVASDNSKRIADLEGRLEHCEMKQRERNLIFYGFEGTENETPDAPRSCVLNLISSSMQIPEEIGLEQCRRISRKANSPLLIEVPDYKQRILLLRNAFKLRDKKIFLNKDYPATFDIFVLTETWCQNPMNFAVENYKIHHSSALKTLKRGRSLGGVIMGVSKRIQPLIEKVEVESQWISAIFKLVPTADSLLVFMIFVYLPPIQTQLENLKKLFSYIENKLQEGFEIVLYGDLNVRTCDLGDFHNLLDTTTLLSASRASSDPVSSSLSETLVDFFDDISLTILNGRSTSDRNGNFTFISSQGSSVIDLAVVSPALLELIVDLSVECMPYSDHLPLVLKLKGLNNMKKNQKKRTNTLMIYRMPSAMLETLLNFGR
ncbi:hypothetical protein LAZ67_X003040 [Cordylochernes scorpioides]|uniref:Endonuclease/exonuclease/phosphatase domain-containing protein n=1 Tax=Cordylochernes scorpioides TaxID=51811 RepID=A0ABY6LU91_9ARAC|nr:hypothetical protein LAZ67_X003040 [Cordylochernes scorpioides]